MGLCAFFPENQTISSCILCKYLWFHWNIHIPSHRNIPTFVVAGTAHQFQSAVRLLASLQVLLHQLLAGSSRFIQRPMNDRRGWSTLQQQQQLQNRRQKDAQQRWVLHVGRVATRRQRALGSDLGGWSQLNDRGIRGTVWHANGRQHTGIIVQWSQPVQRIETVISYLADRAGGPMCSNGQVSDDANVHTYECSPVWQRLIEPLRSDKWVNYVNGMRSIL